MTATLTSYTDSSSALDSVLSDEHDVAKVERYLQTVSNNVNQIVTKIIWNAHSRAVNLLANDGKESVNFWDFESFDRSEFDDFNPEAPSSVVHQMQESWHRAFGSPPMVRYTTKDYPTGKHYSPFEEIDGTAETLFRNQTQVLNTGRVVKLPSKRNKGRGVLGATTRPEVEHHARSNWLHDLMVLPVPSSNPCEPTPAADATSSRTPAEEIHPIADGRGSSEEHVELDPTVQDEPSRLEVLVNQYGPDVLLQDQAQTSLDDDSSSEIPKVPTWRTRLLEDHERRLIEKCPGRQQRTEPLDLSIKAVINQAVMCGLIKPPGVKVCEAINTAARIEEQKAIRTSIAQKKLMESMGTVQISSKSRNRQAPMTRTPRGTRKPTPGEPSRKKPKVRPNVSENARTRQAPETKNSNGKRKPTSGRPARKKQRVGKEASETATHPPEPASLLPHPSGSKTLELHQALPPNAYFEPKSDEELPAWRCGIRHAMGYYYNAGDRMNCSGCFTSIKTNPRLKRMDFYLPSRSYFHQAAPGIIWKPSLSYVKSRRCKTLSHNSIAKDAFWDAIKTGSNDETARQRAVEAVEESLKPKPKPKPAPRAPTPTPEPEIVPIDLGPHPSGSKTMEHGQDIPECAYWEEKEGGEVFAWRCDVNHALGRYYMAGNKSTCPGCGSNKIGQGKRAEMDFYLPDGAVVRQDAPDLVKWRPRKPYNTKPRRPFNAKSKAHAPMSHNQICSKNYWKAVGAGQELETALAIAIAETDAELDAKNEETRIKQEEYQAKLDEAQKRKAAAQKMREERKAKAESSAKVKNGPSKNNGNTGRGVVVPLIPRKRGSQELTEDDSGESGESRSGSESESGSEEEASQQVAASSSSDESTSSSDSE